jgi:anti-anti-sigma factor
MELQYSQRTITIHVIKLIGKLDIVGTGEVEAKFVGHCAGENRRVLVDLSDVDYLASIGIRLLILTAKSVVGRGGRMVLLSPSPKVQTVLEMTGVPGVVPVYSQREAAEAALAA